MINRRRERRLLVAIGFTFNTANSLNPGKWAAGLLTDYEWGIIKKLQKQSARDGSLFSFSIGSK